MLRFLLCLIVAGGSSLAALSLPTDDWRPGRGVHPEVATRPDAISVAWLGHSTGETILYQVNFLHANYLQASKDMTTIIAKLYTAIGSTGKVLSLQSASINGEANFGNTLDWAAILDATSQLRTLIGTLTYPDQTRDIERIDAYAKDFAVRGANNETKTSFSKPEVAVSGFISYVMEVAARADRAFPPLSFGIDYAVYLEEGYSYEADPANVTRAGTHHGTLIASDRMALRRSMADQGNGTNIQGDAVNGVLWISEGRLGLGGYVLAPGSRMRMVLDPKCVTWPGDPTLMAWRSRSIEVDKNRNLVWSWNNMRGVYTEKNEEIKQWNGPARHDEAYKFRFDTRTVTWYNEIKAWQNGLALPLIDVNKNLVVDIEEYAVWRDLIANGTIAATNLAWSLGGVFYTQYKDSTGLVPMASLPSEYQAAVVPIPVPPEPEAWIDQNTLIQAYWMGNYTPPQTPP